MPTIVGAMPSLNRAARSKSRLILRGTGFVVDQPASAQFRSLTWSGSVIWASARGKFGMLDLTRGDSVDDLGKLEPDETQEVTVTVEGTSKPISVDLYDE